MKLNSMLFLSFIIGFIVFLCVHESPKYKVGDCLFDNTYPYSYPKSYTKIVGISDSEYTYIGCLTYGKCDYWMGPSTIKFKDFENGKDGNGKTRVNSPINCEEI